MRGWSFLQATLLRSLCDTLKELRDPRILRTFTGMRYIVSSPHGPVRGVLLAKGRADRDKRHVFAAAQRCYARRPNLAGAYRHQGGIDTAAHHTFTKCGQNVPSVRSVTVIPLPVALQPHMPRVRC